MPENQSNTTSQKPVKKRTSPFKVVLIILGLLLALLALKVILIMTAKPTISVDYAAELNYFSKPPNYDPNQNAAPYYKRAFERLVDNPDIMRRYWGILPSDMNEATLDTLKKWLALNSRALDYLEQASAKPYYWIERYAGFYWIARVYEEEFSGFEDTFEIHKFHIAVNALESQTKLETCHSLTEHTLSRVINMYRIGAHLSGPKTLMEQLIGMEFQNTAISCAFLILDMQQVNTRILKNFQERLEHEILKNKKRLDFHAEKLLVYDIIQRVFSDNSKGDGNLIPGQAFRLIKPAVIMGISMSEVEWIRMEQCRYAHLIWIALTGSGRRDTKESVDKFFAYVETLKGQMPWQLHSKGIDSDEQICGMLKGYIIEKAISAIYPVIERYQRLKAKESALITTIAILRYKAEKDRLLENLDQLVAAGYLNELPMDPYSDSPLVYKRIGDDFTLYSFGVDFDDDGGVRSKWGKGEQGGDQVFWPVERPK